MRRLFSSSVFACLVVAASASAHAQEDPRRTQAAVPFEEGLKLHDEGREAAALEKFREAYEIYPSPNALFQIARSEELLGRYVDALRHYREAMQNPMLHPKNRELGAQYIASIEERIARVEVRGPDGMTVTLLGKEYRLPLDGPIALDITGPIGATGELGSERYEGQATATAGAVSVLEMTLVVGGTGATGALDVTTPPEEPPAKGAFWGWRSITGLTLIGVGAAALTATVVFTSNESSHADRARELNAALPSGTSACGSPTAPPECAELTRELESRNDARAAKNAALPIGVVAAGAGAALVLSSVIWPHSPSRSGLFTPVVGPRLAAASFRIAF